LNTPVVDGQIYPFLPIGDNGTLDDEETPNATMAFVTIKCIVINTTCQYI